MTAIKKAVNRLLKDHPKVCSGLEIFGSFLPWCAGRKTPPKGALRIKVHRQWTDYSCTAAVSQMVLHYYGIDIGHRKAIELTGCKSDGAILSDVANILAREYGFAVRELSAKSQIRKALQQGYPVMTNDSVSFAENHAILCVGETPKGFWIADPRTCEIYWKHEDRIMAGADECLAIISEKPLAEAAKTPARRL